MWTILPANTIRLPSKILGFHSSIFFIFFADWTPIWGFLGKEYHLEICYVKKANMRCSKKESWRSLLEINHYFGAFYRWKPFLNIWKYIFTSDIFRVLPKMKYTFWWLQEVYNQNAAEIFLVLLRLVRDRMSLLSPGVIEDNVKNF